MQYYRSCNVYVVEIITNEATKSRSRIVNLSSLESVFDLTQTVLDSITFTGTDVKTELSDLLSEKDRILSELIKNGYECYTILYYYINKRKQQTVMVRAMLQVAIY